MSSLSIGYTNSRKNNAYPPELKLKLTTLMLKEKKLGNSVRSVITIAYQTVAPGVTFTSWEAVCRNWLTVAEAAGKSLSLDTFKENRGRPRLSQSEKVAAAKTRLSKATVAALEAIHVER